MELQFVGSGDAFGSGGRFNTCFQVRHGQGSFLIDCGASTMVALRRWGIEPNSIDAIVISHLHGDHFGGLPFFILEAQLVSRRTAPLVIAGPPGLRTRLETAMETFFPGSTKVERRFAVEVQEMQPRVPHRIGAIEVTPHLMKHPCGAPPFALRIAVESKVVCYSGDTEWVDELAEAARGADLFVAEAYSSAKPIKFHLDYAVLSAQLPSIGAKRVIVTHMGPEMLERRRSLDCEAAEDGMVISI
ncbi:Ribonuclease BN, tRNA processing enzyme [Enhydrobacter aerosaccus]|uniref:Ribonuclease BN, tRNA processing enzyme n=1 Tax=Enhydrobacter aerosaccus TaxID=225324 RepID=A0A1T4TK44_9HYPH|nr:MBL fold metallo-hydrolase [Enhydrobacter aerosaccus]SKA40856.1 Ribonuclease BN, tRNA processing enzyme [Enhydrobacter aerosaccus]